MASNRKTGNRFEEEFSQVLFQNGFWVHKLTQNEAGQPADIIAVKNGNAYLIDCKVCAYNKFPLSRIEDNQYTSMELWGECNNGTAWFALDCRGDVYMISYDKLCELVYETSVLQYEDIQEYGTPLGRWVQQC